MNRRLMAEAEAKMFEAELARRAWDAAPPEMASLAEAEYERLFLEGTQMVKAAAAAEPDPEEQL